MMQCCKEDCYWYDEWQDMNAHIPYCKCKNADFIEPKDCENCEQYHSKYKPTNADRIRAMSDEKLAEYLYNIWKGQDTFSKEVCERCGDTDIGCRPNCWLDWLRKEEESEVEG